MTDVFLSPREAKDFVANPTSTTNAFKQTVSTGLLSAMGNGKNSTTIDISGKSASDIREVLGTLNRIGYKAQIAKGNLIEVSW